MGQRAIRLGDLLLQVGAITKEQLGAALAMQMRVGGRLGSNLIELGAVDEKTVAHVLAQQLNIPSASAAQLNHPTKAALERVTRALAVRHRAVPLRIDGDRLWVALADPTDGAAIAAIEKESGLAVRAMVAPDVLIDFALGKHYGARRSARIIEVRDAELLEVEPVEELPTYAPYEAGARGEDLVAAPVGLGFLDEQRAASKIPKLAKITNFEAVRAQLASASTDEVVFTTVLEVLGGGASKLALLLIRGGMLVGHRGLGIDTRSLGLIRLPLGETPALARLLEQHAPYFGPLPRELGALFQALGTPSGLVLPLTLGKKVIGVVVGGQVADDLPGRSAELARLTKMVDLSLHIGHLRARLARV